MERREGPDAAVGAAAAAADVRVWFTRIADVPPALEARYHALMTPQERTQQQRFMFEKDRRRYLVTRALVRDVLGRCTGQRPEALRFEADAYGKPRLVGVDGAPGFNLTHTDDLVMLAVTDPGRRVGIDVERIDRRAPLEIAERYFAPRETAAMQALPLPLQPKRFWELWTLKESYVKAYGMGLSIPLDQFHFTLAGEDAAPVLGFEAGWVDDAARWGVRLFRPTGGHQAALCVERLVGDPAVQALTLAATWPLAAA